MISAPSQARRHAAEIIGLHPAGRKMSKAAAISAADHDVEINSKTPSERSSSTIVID